MGGGWLMAVLLTVSDPGLTVDEPINVTHGARMVRVTRAMPTWMPAAESIDEIWRDGHEHPPLTRCLLGWSHEILSAGSGDGNRVDPRLGRPMGAVALGVLIVLVTRFCWRLSGPVGGLVAGMSLPLFPRVFGHAHLASPELLSATFFFAGMMAAGWAFDESGESDGGLRRGCRFLVAALMLGLALLAKMSNVLLLPAVGISLLARQGRRGIVRFLPWSVLGICLFLVGWPWLWPVDLAGYRAGWHGTLDRVLEYFSSAVSRATIYVWYFGKQYPNDDGGVPWHFAWVFLLVTVPSGFQVIALAVGVPQVVRLARRGFRSLLLLVSIAVILGFFTLPVERYDGERLFVYLFPLWSVVVGIGTASVMNLTRRWLPPMVGNGLLFVFIASQGIGIWRLHPCELSYYNAFVGGLPGAVRRGLEANYWGDSLTDPLLAELARAAKPGDRAALLPTMHYGHAYHLNAPVLRSKDVTLVPGDQLLEAGCRWVILYRREGYIHDPLPTAVMREGTVVAEVAREGVWLARLYELPKGWQRTLNHETSSPAEATGK